MAIYTNKDILKISYPIILSLFAQTFINVIDTAFLGHVSEIALGASAMGGLFYFCIYTLAFGYSIGTQIVIARRNGEGNYAQIGPTAIQGIFFLLLMALVLFVFTHIYGAPIMRIINSSDKIFYATMEFLDYRIYGFFFSFAGVIFRALYIGITKTKVLTINAFVMALTNIILDYALIFGHWGFPAMGIKGAAIASVIAEATSLCFLVAYTYIAVDFKKYGFTHFRSFDLKLLLRILKISSFTMLQQFIIMSTFFFFFVAVERLSERSLAIANVVRSIYIILFIPVNAFSTTANTMVSNCIGSGGSAQVKKLIAQISRISFIIVMVMITLCAIFPQAILSIYTNNDSLINDSIPSVHVICIAIMIASVSRIIYNSISGTGDTQAALYIEITTMIIYLCYVFFVGMYLKASVAVCFTCEILYFIVQMIASIIYFKIGRWEKKEIRI